MNPITDIIQSPLFAKLKKKLNKSQRTKLDIAIQEIISNPTCGDVKLGDLKGIRVYKFKMGITQILLSYEVVDTRLNLYSFGSHQNFYKELSKYLHQ